MKTANWKALPGPENIVRAVLPNGITVLARTNFNSPSVSIGGYLASGSMYDSPTKLGLAHYTALCLMRGTHKRSFQDIYNTIESAGASLGMGASVHNVNFGGRSLAEDLPMLLNLLTEVLSSPSFPLEQVERLRAQLLTSLAIRNQDTGDRVEMAIDAILFPEHPYGLPEDGHPETIQAITCDDIKSFHTDRYHPDNLVIAIVGAVEAQNVIDLVQETLGQWNDPVSAQAVVFPPIRELRNPVRQHLALPGKFQTDLAIGVHGPKRLEPDYISVSLGNSILGQFGMMGRIGEVVREKSGLAYYASASLSATKEGGSWEVSAGVNPADLQRAIDLIINELDRFIQEPVTKEELHDSQANFIGRLPLSLESNSGVVNALLNLERFQLGLDYYQRYAGLVQSVTPAMILEAAKKYWITDCLAIVSAGPELQKP